jgi:DnaJ family protein C protein 13
MLFCYKTLLEGKVRMQLFCSVEKLMYHFRYKRIFSVGTMGITTYNPSTLEVTNRWAYSDFISLQPQKSAGNTPSEFVITMKKERKIDHMKFSTEHRAQLMTEALKFRHSFAEKPKEVLVSNFYLC